MTQPTLRLVVFDMAGTTVHDEDFVNKAFQEALAAADLSADPAAINAIMGYPKHQAIRMLLSDQGMPEEEIEAQADTILDDFVERMDHFYATDPQVREIEGASDDFQALHDAGVKVALNTGFFRSTADAIMKRLGWDTNGLVDATVTSDEVEQGRPQPDMIYRSMELTGVEEASTVAKVGDTPADLLEGTNAGCPIVIGVTEGTHTADELGEQPHTHLTGSVTDVLDILLPQTEKM